MITFDGFNLRNYVDKINKINRPVLSPREHTLVNIPGMAGAIIARSKTGVKTIGVKVQIFGQTKAEIRSKVNALAEVLLTEKPAPLTFSDEPNKTYMAIVANETAFEELSVLGSAEILFLCPDPYANGTTKEITIFTNTDISITGNVATFPTYTVTMNGPTSYFEIIKQSTGEKIRVNFNLLTGSVIVFNHKDNVVTINGTVNNATISLDSEFFSMKPGVDRLTLVTQSPATVRLKYVERWL